MTATTHAPEPLMLNVDSISSDEANKMASRGGHRKNHAVGFFYATVPASSRVVSESTPISCMDDMEATQHCSNDSGQSHSPSESLSIRAPQKDVIQSQSSPHSVISPHISEMKDITTKSSPMHLQGHESGADQSNCAPRRKVKVEMSYDMNLVPMVQKNPLFLKTWRKITLSDVGLTTSSSAEDFEDDRKSFCRLTSTYSMPNLVPCDGSCDESAQEPDAVSEDAAHAASCDSSASSTNDKHARIHVGPCHACLPESDRDQSPFGSDFESVIWAPRTRADWEESIDEMVALCTAAAWHKHKTLPYRTKRKTEFHAPISRIYVKDRIHIDDPLRGYQIRHKNGGWLQGFIMMTDFTTWTHYFKWDSGHSANGIDRHNTVGLIDDGTLASELEEQFRSGDPLGEGVVWPTVAEISLVGALGCGEYLVQMSLEDIARRGCYEYVVLEATETSRSFYEKFGFVRVGAVCKYGNEKDIKDANGEVQDVGYRHWSYAHMTEEGLNDIGAPSCMMARRIKKFDPESICSGCGTKGTSSFVDQLGRYFVLDKPSIKMLGSTQRKRSMSGAYTPSCKGRKKAKVTTPSVSIPSSVTFSGRRSKAPDRLEDFGYEVTRSRRSTNTSLRSSSTALGTDQTSGITNTSHKDVILRKQIISSGYRCPMQVYYYNKIVTPKTGAKKSSYKSKYYFVLNYDTDEMTIRVIPLYVSGTFKGKREGRPKWKANVHPRDGLDEESYWKSMDVVTTSVSEWNIVKAHAVTKCVSVQGESWDIVDDE